MLPCAPDSGNMAGVHPIRPDTMSGEDAQMSPRRRGRSWTVTKSETHALPEEAGSRRLRGISIALRPLRWMWLLLPSSAARPPAALTRRAHIEWPVCTIGSAAGSVMRTSEGSVRVSGKGGDDGGVESPWRTAASRGGWPSGADDKEADDKEKGYSSLSVFNVARAGGLAASPGSCRTIASRGQKRERSDKGGSGWAATCWASRRSTGRRSRSSAARARTWESSRGSKASACRPAFA